MAAPTAPTTTGVSGDLQTVVAAQQALTVQVGNLIQQLTAGQTSLSTALTAITTAITAVTAALTALTAAITAMSAALAPVSKKYFHFAAAGSSLVNTGPTKLYGIALNNFDPSGATFASVTIYDGTSTGGAIVGAITFVQGFSVDYGDTGLELATGLYAVAAGTPVDLTLFWNTG